jgi:hypothetical protein
MQAEKFVSFDPPDCSDLEPGEVLLHLIQRKFDCPMAQLVKADTTRLDPAIDNAGGPQSKGIAEFALA